MPPPSDLLSDPEIAQAYEDVRSDKSETTWLVLKYASATSDDLKLAATGKGDIAELTESLGDDEAAYGYIRMKLGNDEYSERVKFAFIVWAGELSFCLGLGRGAFTSGSAKSRGGVGVVCIVFGWRYLKAYVQSCGFSY